MSCRECGRETETAAECRRATAALARREIRRGVEHLDRPAAGDRREAKAVEALADEDLGRSAGWRRRGA